MIKWSFGHALVPASAYALYAKKLLSYHRHLQGIVASTERYTQPESSIQLSTDSEALNRVLVLANEYRKHNPLVVVVGIGGSNLGTQAFYDALRCQWQMPKDGIPVTERILFADTVDRFKLRRITDEIKFARKKNRRVVLNIISKSGATTETIVNAEYLKKYAGPFERTDIVITTDEGSPLWKLAQLSGYPLLAIPSIIGGRYSVFTPVGLFPLAVVGFDIEKLLSGARWSSKSCLRSLASSPAFKSAATLYYHATHRKVINDNFFFRTDLESLGKWYRQLMGESIGKVGKGMTPTVSIGSIDLHSMAQLYLGGPQDKVTTFVSVAQRHSEQREESRRDPSFWTQDDVRRLPKKTVLGSLVGGAVDGRTTSEVMDAILRGTTTAYARKEHPFMEVSFEKLDEEHLGAFMQWKMIEMMFLGQLFGVNAFDQPNVEEYKVVTKKLLRQ